MSLKIMPLPQNDEAKEAMRGMLTEALAQVERGEILDIAIATVVKRGDSQMEMFNEYWGQSQFAALVGSVAWLQHSLITGMEE